MEWFEGQIVTEFSYLKINGDTEKVNPRPETVAITNIGVHYTPFGVVSVTIPWSRVLEVWTK